MNTIYFILIDSGDVCISIETFESNDDIINNKDISIVLRNDLFEDEGGLSHVTNVVNTVDNKLEYFQGFCFNLIPWNVNFFVMYQDTILFTKIGEHFVHNNNIVIKEITMNSTHSQGILTVRQFKPYVIQKSGKYFIFIYALYCHIIKRIFIGCVICIR